MQYYVSEEYHLGIPNIIKGVNCKQAKKDPSVEQESAVLSQVWIIITYSRGINKQKIPLQFIILPILVVQIVCEVTYKPVGRIYIV